MLLILLVRGSSQGEQADRGRYEAVSANGEWIELEKKEKAPLYIMDSEFQAKWKKDGESMKYTWKGDTMVLNFPDGSSFDLDLSDATLSLQGSWGKLRSGSSPMPAGMKT